MQSVQGYLLNLSENTSIGFLFQNKYLYALVILLAFFILSRFVKFLLHRVIPIFTKRTKTNIDDQIVEKTQGIASLLVLLLGLYVSLIPLNLPSNVSFGINRSILSIVIFLFAIFGMRVIDVMIDTLGKRWAKRTKSSIDDALLPLFHKVSKTLFFIFSVIIVIRSWGFNIGSLLAGVGIAGMVLGLALKDSLANIFGGISLVLDKSIKVGDKIKLDSGEVGVIHDIGLRSSKVKTYDNEIIILPNNGLANSKIINYVAPTPHHRAVVKFGVEYGNDIEKVKKVALNAIQGIENAIYDDEERKPLVVFSEMGESSINFSALIWSTWDKSHGVKMEATKRIYEAMNKAKIGIAFPTRTVHMFQHKRG